MTAKRAKFLLLTILVVISLFFLLEKSFVPGLSSKLSPYKNYELVEKVIYLIKNEYIEEPNPSKTMEGAFRGLVNSLDILSTYLNKKSVINYHQRKDSNLKDVGIILYKKYGLFPQVLGIIENSPAEKQGVKIGDYISALNDRSTLAMSLIETNLSLKNKEEIPIQIKILRRNKTQWLRVERTQLFKDRFSFSSAKGTSGILKIHQLYPDCVNEIKEKILPRLKLQKKPLILDLRNCYEGEIEEAQKLINLFLRASKIGFFEKKGGVKDILSCPENAELEKLRLIIWTNQATIGPAEAVAAVLKEFKKAKIIGLQTVGLVAKQNFISLEDGSALLLTSGIFSLSSGKKIWEKGVKPDVKIERKSQSYDSYLAQTQNLLSKM